ncbi:FAD-dependent monooxygenase [Gordonia sp. (in: high G+C Gram-positive bacteria)]|uniref:FAD-dependent monooxygenase n=1 Tax=Gordonia sp. (in: high G+C Gram-positive bacteria) TaxID=84139 RepID=UPI002614188E|nr:FAD-dependent monooxygenase [Gordonia sp. (in: high G+C Gram-positive bacteria)]
MKLNTVAVLGGGPGGLYAARLLKRSNPDADVVVYEQGEPDKTFGFGVGLASRTQRNLNEADSSSLEEIISVAYPHDMAMRVPSGEARLTIGGLIGIGRAKLLEVLQRHAEAAGVRLEYGQRRTDADVEADLIVAADGISSAVRTAHAEELGASIVWDDVMYLWCGVDFALPTALFTPVTTEHGTFVAHAYPYSENQSTFLIETDQETWRNAGFDVTTENTAPADNDEVALAYLSDAFAEALHGHRLVGNRTRWMRFRTVNCDKWYTGNVALLGDAVHTAHYSIGSGTKLAMEDAIALDTAVRESDTLDEALERYQTERKPGAAYLQEIAARSMGWWASFPDRMDLPVDQLMIAYMTRAGKVSLPRFLGTAPDIARRGLAAYAGVDVDQVPDGDEVIGWVLDQPLTRGGRTFADRRAPGDLADARGTAVREVDVDLEWSADADRIVDELAGAGVVWLRGGDDRGSVLTRLAVAGRVSEAGSALVVAEVPADAAGDAAAALAAGRVDLVHLS